MALNAQRESAVLGASSEGGTMLTAASPAKFARCSPRSRLNAGLEVSTCPAARLGPISDRTRPIPPRVRRDADQ